MIKIDKLCLNFGTQKIFNDISFTLNNNQKVGLVGLNGSGKSTLLKVIAGLQQQDSGNITKTANKKIGYMPQEVVLTSNKSVIDEVLTAIEIFDESEIESIKAEIKKVLMGLGFNLAQIDQKVTDLSVGWRMRVILAQLLMQKADFYLFDEPTNHLDIVTKNWFLNFLKKANFGFLLVCHEKYFLDNLCDSILELENNIGTNYKGNYSSYIQQKEARQELLHAAYVQQQKDIQRKQATINRFKASASRSTMAKSMQKALDKIELIELPTSNKKVNFKLPEITQPGQIVLTINNIAHSFDNKKIFSNISFKIERNQKVAIIAANGVGKTTLLNLVMNKLVLKNGNINFGHNVNAAFFEQDQVRALDPEKTIFETIQDAAPKVTDLAIRSMLGCFLFTKDSINKKTKVLSGGERNRLSMVRVLLQQANLLILDEPTNHLDIISKEILLDALKQYNGTILFVSHDQDFVNNLATDIIELTPTEAIKFSGNYNDYLTHKEYLEKNFESSEKIKAKENEPSRTKNNYEQNKEIRKLENQIEKIEKEISKLSLELAKFDYNSKDFTQRYEQVGKLQKKHKLLLEDWEKLTQ